MENFHLKFKKIYARVPTAIDLSGSTITSWKFYLLYLKTDQLMSVGSRTFVSNVYESPAM